ncbi:MAG: V-type ATP synthase subunit K [Oscillospiraceae bacterium]|nr:V-type ATP synthase subunit K [Oscillospiraceae bacterium]
MIDQLFKLGGLSMALLGAGLSAFLCCFGSARATGMAGESATGIIIDDPAKFSKCLIIQIIPGTQGLYGVVIAFYALLKMGFLAGTAASMSMSEGLRYLTACLPMALGGFLSAIYQGRVAASCMNIIAKKPDDWAKGMIFCITVEFYAILSLLISFLMLLNL